MPFFKLPFLSNLMSEAAQSLTYMYIYIYMGYTSGEFGSYAV